MIRGRKSIEQIIIPLILSILAEFKHANTNFLRSEISKRLEKEISWNTVRKYTEQLIILGKIGAYTTPGSQKKKFIVYELKS